MLRPPPPELPWWMNVLCTVGLAGLIGVCSRIIVNFIVDLFAPEE